MTWDDVIEERAAATTGHDLAEARPVHRADHQGRSGGRGVGGEARTTGGDAERADTHPRQVVPTALVGHAVKSPRPEGDAHRRQTGGRPVGGDRVEPTVGGGIGTVAIGTPQGRHRRELDEEVERPVAAEQMQPPGAGELATQCHGEAVGVHLRQGRRRESARAVDDAAHRGHRAALPAGGGERRRVVAVGGLVANVHTVSAQALQQGAARRVEPLLGAAPDQQQVTCASVHEAGDERTTDGTEPTGDQVGGVRPESEFRYGVGSHRSHAGGEDAPAPHGEDVVEVTGVCVGAPTFDNA